MDCVTPSHPNAIPPGESMDIVQLLEKGDEASLDPSLKSLDPPQPDRFSYTPRKPVMESLQTPHAMQYLRAQVATTPAELNKILKELKPAPARKPFPDEMGGGAQSKRSSRPRGRPAKQQAHQEGAPVRRYSQSPHLVPVDDGRYSSSSWYDFENRDHFLSRTWGNTAVDVGLMRRSPMASRANFVR